MTWIELRMQNVLKNSNFPNYYLTANGASCNLHFFFFWCFKLILRLWTWTYPHGCAWLLSRITLAMSATAISNPIQGVVDPFRLLTRYLNTIIPGSTRQLMLQGTDKFMEISLVNRTIINRLSLFLLESSNIYICSCE